MIRKNRSFLIQMITCVILSGVLFLLSLCAETMEVYADSPGVQVTLEAIPKGEHAEDAEGKIWARELEVFATFRCSQMMDADAAVELIDESGNRYEMNKACSEDGLVIVARCSITKNGCYKINTTLLDGPATIAVWQIDQTAPQIETVISPTIWTEGTAKVTVNANDTESGLATEPYSFDGGQTYQVDNTCYKTKSETFEVCVRDRLGNVATRSITIEKKPIVVVSENGIDSSQHPRDTEELASHPNESHQQESVNERNELKRNESRDSPEEDITRPAVENGATVEAEQYASFEKLDRKQDNQPELHGREEKPLQLPVRQETKQTVHSVDETEEDVRAKQRDLADLTVAKQTVMQKLWRKPMVQKVVKVGLPIGAILFAVIALFLAVQRIQTVEVFGEKDGVLGQKMGEAKLGKKEKKHVLYIPEGVILAKEGETVRLRFSMVFVLLHRGKVLYIAYLGKTLEHEIAPEIPFIV